MQRLKPRKLKEGVVELAPREALSEEESKALALAPGAPYAWPLRGVHPQHLQVGWGGLRGRRLPLACLATPAAH